MKFNFTVREDRITSDENYEFIEGNKGSYEAVFNFPNESVWEDCAKTCVVECGSDIYTIPIIGGSCLLPEFIQGSVRIGVIGVDTLDGADLTTRVSTNMLRFGINDGAANKKATAKLTTAAEVWEVHLADMEKSRKAAEKAKKSAEGAATNAKVSADKAAKSEANAKKFAESVTEMTVDAEGLSEGSSPTVKKSQVGDVIHLSFGIPKGEQGKKGIQGSRGPQGLKGEKGDKGEKGEKGDKGTDGIGVKGIIINSSDELVITLTDNTVLNLGNIKGGPKGEKGTDGIGVKGIIINSSNELVITLTDDTVLNLGNVKGDKGEKGTDGYTPKKGTDYWTEADKAEIKSYVDEAILGGVW